MSLFYLRFFGIFLVVGLLFWNVLQYILFDHLISFIAMFLFAYSVLLYFFIELYIYKKIKNPLKIFSSYSDKVIIFDKYSKSSLFFIFGLSCIFVFYAHLMHFFVYLVVGGLYAYFKTLFLVLWPFTT